MATASDRPPAREEMGAQNSQVLLDSASLGSAKGAKQTGSRVRMKEPTEKTEASPSMASLSPSTVGPNVPAESLKKPFASLTPKKPTTSQALGEHPGTPPPPPSQLFKETASLRPPTSSPLGSSGRSTSKRPDTAPAARRGSCEVHGTALTSQGTCVLCARETERRRAKRVQWIILSLAALAIAVGLAAAYVVMPK